VTPPAESDALSLHDALPISRAGWRGGPAWGRVVRSDAAHRPPRRVGCRGPLALLREVVIRDWGRGADRRWSVRRPQAPARVPAGDRKSTRLNSSHVSISYAV